MSIYATLLSIDGDTDDPDHVGAPYIYRGSHVLPTAGDDRDGWVEVAGIPAFCGEDPTRLVDFLRLDVMRRTQVLDRVQVTALRDTFTIWLNREVEKG